MTNPAQFPLIYVGPEAVDSSDVVTAPDAVNIMTAPGVMTEQSVQNQLAEMQTPASHTAPPNPAPLAGQPVYATTAYMQSYLTPAPPDPSDQTALTAAQIPKPALGTPQASALAGQYYAVAKLDSSSLLSPSIFPPGGQGFLMGSWGPTLEATSWPQSGLSPVNIANWAIGPQNISNWMPWVFASVSVSSTMAYPVVYVTMTNASITGPVPVFNAANVIGVGQGRRFFDTPQPIVTIPSNPSNVSTFSNAATYSIYASLWVANLLGSTTGSQITGATINTAGLYLWQGTA